MSKRALCVSPVVLIFALLMGCNPGDPGPEEGVLFGPGGVRLGMSRTEVIQVMLDEVRLLQMSGQASNPYATRFVNDLRDEQLEVMYYYTGMKKPDDRVSAEELVPIILKDDSVIGWGWETLEGMTGTRPSPRM